MKLIFYDEASEILGVSQDVLRQATARGDLTRAGTEGNRQRLIKEQVMLFVGTNPRTGHKKRISRNSLSTQEQALWNHYAAEVGRPVTSAVNEDALRELVRQELLQQRLEDIRRQAAAKRAEAEAATQEEERFSKELPFLIKREAVLA